MVWKDYRVRILITGAGGFAGQHLIRHLASTNPENEIFATIYNASKPSQFPETVTSIALDLLDEKRVLTVLDAVHPDAIYHLAAQSSPSLAMQSIWPTFEANVKSQLNLIEGCLALNIKPRLLITTSGEVYHCDPTNPQPLTEETNLVATNPYALSKVTQDMMGYQYFLSHDFPIIRARPFNHTGPGQATNFVAPDFAFQIAQIEANLQKPIIRVGNLSAQRDFTDVRDVVKAYVLLVEQGQPGLAYNIASNKAYSIQYVLDTLLSFTKTDIDVLVDPDKLRSVDVPIKQGDYTRLHQSTGWKPTISFEQTLHDLLKSCRSRVQDSFRSS